ncbi:SoxR reducing system RseC family protein [Ferrimonas lipolytica]|uniref:SoxR reducing system RseC family protein n=1 Tax=Ferrimonas lipolytica TaxID=2724191 RepID=A0A6H1UI84_9GAMM|nr:SoxR reducing system RseC family protein [Ferrimonas lipolytica]QIZ77502.1 SoxR reducing system RseC family protein [Ferrimonas lipolytica]
MIEAIATVEASQAGTLTISWFSQTACGHCEQADECGSGVVAKAMAPKQNRLTIDSKQHYPIGTQLRVGIAEQDLLKASAAVYLLPLVSGIGMAMAAQATIGTEAVTILASIIGGVIGWAVARSWAAKQPKPLTILGQLGEPLSGA